MKTLTIDCRMASMSGIGVYLRNIVPLCMAMLPSVKFRLLNYNHQFTVPKNCTWESLPFNAPIYSIKEQYKIIPLLKGCDAFWTPHYPIPIMSSVPIIATIHDVAHLALYDLYKGMMKLYAKFMFHATRFKAKEIIFVSKTTQQEYLHYVGMPKGNMTVVHNGVDSCWLKFPLQERAGLPYFLAVGNIKPHKNIPMLCRAFAKIAPHCEANLVIVGESDGFRTAETSTKNLADICPGRISFTGFITQEKLISLVRNATALVFPSRYEGFGLPMLEALGAGTPVIASDIQISHEVCANSAMYFSLHDEKQLTDSLRKVLELSSQQRKTIGEKGRQHACQFTWEKAAGTTSHVLKRALKITP